MNSIMQTDTIHIASIIFPTLCAGRIARKLAGADLVECFDAICQLSTHRSLGFVAYRVNARGVALRTPVMFV